MGEVGRPQRLAAGVVSGVLLSGVTVASAAADSSSPRLAAYYDRQMAIVDGAVYAWEGADPPKRMPVGGVQVGVGRESYYVLTGRGDLLAFENSTGPRMTLMSGVVRFAAGESGVMAVKKNEALWWIERGSRAARKIAEGVASAAVGDGANYYVTKSGALFVKGRAHRGQYGDGRLETTRQFVQTASDVAQITAHTGHAIFLGRNGDVMGTGGNIYGPVGRHGLGDKAVRWSRIVSGVRAIATGSSHTLAIRQDGTLVAWGRGYGPEPVAVMAGVAGVAAGSHTTIALKRDGSLWQWDRGQGRPRRLSLK